VIKTCNDYQSSVRNASKDIDHIIQQLIGFREVLEYLVSIMASERYRLLALERLGAPDGLLIILGDEMKTLETKLKPAIGRKNRMKQALAWPLKAKDVNMILSRIESIKSTIQLALATDQMYVRVYISTTLLFTLSTEP
jgi:hypothetical protein